MKLSKTQFKQLVREVLNEVEADASTLDPKTNTGGSPESDFTANTKAAEKKGEELTIKLSVRGVKPGGSFKKVLAKLAADALAADWQVLRADMEKAGGIKVSSMNDEDLGKIARHVGKPDLAPTAAGAEAGGEEEPAEDDIKSVNPAAWKNMSPEKRDKYIKAGSHEAEWKQATANDEKSSAEKTKKRKELEKSGQLKMFVVNPDAPEQDQFELPEDDSLWTDKEWDMYNTKEKPKFKPSGEYSPRQGKATAHVKKGAVPSNFSSTLR